MIPALKIDYHRVGTRVDRMKAKLDRAVGAMATFRVDQRDEYRMYFDLRFREAHASSGRFADRGTAGNLPSGEAYIVPYEGEKDETRQTEGVLPVQINKDMVLFSIADSLLFNYESGETETIMADGKYRIF